MSVETAADLATMFDADEFAESASYVAPTLGASAVPCSVIVDRGQGRERFSAGQSSAVGSERHLWVRKAELASVARDGQFTLEAGGEVLKVAGLPKLDQTGALWSVDLVMAG